MACKTVSGVAVGAAKDALAEARTVGTDIDETTNRTLRAIVATDILPDTFVITFDRCSHIHYLCFSANVPSLRNKVVSLLTTGLVMLRVEDAADAPGKGRTRHRRRIGSRTDRAVKEHPKL